MATRFSKEDFFIALALVLSALFIRVPHSSYPEGVVFDEGSIVSFVTNVVKREPFFEPHPPLSFMAFRAVTPELSEDAPYWNRTVTATPFQDFPYRPMRLLNVFLGSLLPVGLFLLARLLGFSVYGSLLPAVLALTDNALVFYSRFILSETMLLVFGVGGIGVTLLALSRRRWLTSLFLAAASGIFLGLSGAVKWTGFGFLLASAAALFVWRRWKTVIPLVLGAVCAYTAVFFVYFGIMRAGPVNVERGFYRGSEVESLSFPGQAPLLDRLSTAAAYSRSILSVQRSEAATLVIGSGRGGPLHWPISAAPLKVWSAPSPLHQFIVLSGNIFSWILGFMAMLVLLWSVISSWCRKMALNHTHLFLVLAYLANYIPFFFIGRQMFLYHYFPALIFSFLAVPAALEVLWPRIEKYLTVPREKAERFVFWAIFISASLTFLSISPMTYGF